MNTEFLTVASEFTNGLQRLIRSLQAHGIRPTVLGLDQPYLGNFHKLYHVLDYVNSNSGLGTIVFADAYDVVAAGTLEEIVETYRQFNSPIVFSAERYCWPDLLMVDSYPATDTPYRFLCSGLWVGEADAIRQLFIAALDLLRPSRLDDQHLLSLLYTSGYQPFTLDTGAELFQSLNDAESDVVWRDGRMHNLVTGSTPLLFHANGKSNFPAELIR